MTSFDVCFVCHFHFTNFYCIRSKDHSVNKYPTDFGQNSFPKFPLYSCFPFTYATPAKKTSFAFITIKYLRMLQQSIETEYPTFNAWYKKKSLIFFLAQHKHYMHKRLLAAATDFQLYWIHQLNKHNIANSD